MAKETAVPAAQAALPKDYYLNDIERTQLASFVNNKTMFEAVKKVILSAVYFSGTLEAGIPAQPGLNFALTLVADRKAGYSNEQLGADLRAISQAVGMLETSFKKFDDYKAPQSTGPAPRNKAR